MSANRSAKRRLEEARRQSAALVPAWRSAVARAVRRGGEHDVRGFADAARDVGLARLDRGPIPTSRRSLDRLMEQAAELHARRRWRRTWRGFVKAYTGAPRITHPIIARG